MAVPVWHGGACILWQQCCGSSQLLQRPAAPLPASCCACPAAAERRNIKKGTELVYNYSYEIGSVPGLEIPCHCGAPSCKGRLL